MLDLDQIRQAKVRSAPYPYFVVNGAMSADRARQAAADFPQIDRPGAVDVGQTAYGSEFKALLDDLRSDQFRALIADKLDLDLDGLDTVINVRAQTRLTDGNIHTDTPSKLVTVLLYFNEPGEVGESGLRILNNGKDLDDYVEEIPPDLGTMLVFKVAPHGWHGHKPFVGERHSLQLNYLSGIKTVGKHQLAHRLVGRMKRKLAALIERA